MTQKAAFTQWETDSWVIFGYKPWGIDIKKKKIIMLAQEMDRMTCSFLLCGRAHPIYLYLSACDFSYFFSGEMHDERWQWRGQHQQ